MTIAALVGHFAATKPRYVTVNGQIVFDEITAGNTGGYMHPIHGPVTPVQKHTFHGGVEEAVEAADHEACWWTKPELIQRHIDEMAQAFPGFTYLSPEPDSVPTWIGQIDTGRGKFPIGIALRSDQGLPRIFLLSKIKLGASAGRRWVRSPHLYDNGNLCVADAAEWDSEIHTAATATAWAAHWLAAYTEWRITRKWPVTGVEAVAA